MKKISVLLAALLILTLFAATASAYTMYVDTANHKTLNLRDANDSSIIIAQIPYRAAVEVDNDWCGSLGWLYVRYNGMGGLVQARYLSSRQPAKQTGGSTNNSTSQNTGLGVFQGMKRADYYIAVTPATPTGIVRLRWAPSTEAREIRACNADEVWRVIAENNTWVQIYNDEEDVCGFMKKSLTQRVNGRSGNDEG